MHCWFVFFFFFFVCISFYDISEGALTWTRERDIKIKVAFIFKLFLFFLLITPHGACGILVPQPGIESRLPAVNVLSQNHWTSREFSRLYFKVLIANNNNNKRENKILQPSIASYCIWWIANSIVAIWPSNPP